MKDFLRVACATPRVFVADPARNAGAMEEKLREADARGTDILVFPELAITGYTCGDLFFQNALLDATLKALRRLISLSGQIRCAYAVGLPLRAHGLLLNCAAMIAGGHVLGIVPKTYLPNDHEFSERRWFDPGRALTCGHVVPSELGLEGAEPIPAGKGLLFHLGEHARVGIEICEDLWSPIPPSSHLALGGAELIINLSASNETVGKRKLRAELVRQQSARCLCAYAFACAGALESTTDLVFSGHSLIAENGRLLAETPPGVPDESLLIMDIDLSRIRAERLSRKTFTDTSLFAEPIKPVIVNGFVPRADGSVRHVSPTPFVPEDKTALTERCAEVFSIQTAGFKRRLQATSLRPVIGISGGLDSSLALMVCVRATTELGRGADNVIGVTMPGLGTTERTHQTALRLMQAMGVTSAEINVSEACRQHLKSIGHDGHTQNRTYENAQARERMQVLMDYASRVNGLVVGTSDLSEAALGWCTYNGDHMSMYAVNAGVPKTLIRAMIDTLRQDSVYAPCAPALADVLAMPISPELLPGDPSGQITQNTEELIGPYVLHDFFIYYMMRFGFAPEKIIRLAQRAFAKRYRRDELIHWLTVFYQRFFSSQFKRSCMPDSVKVGSVSLSPRGDWRMPSDAMGDVWLAETARLASEAQQSDQRA